MRRRAFRVGIVLLASWALDAPAATARDGRSHKASTSAALPVRALCPDFAAIARSARSSVVSIVATGARDDDGRATSSRELFDRYFGGREAPTKGLASGFVVRSDGYILTNSHVVEDSTGLMVSFADEPDHGYPATLVGTDDGSDLALLWIDAGRPLLALPWGDSDQVQVGAWVAAIGNPFGLGHSFTAGVVSFVGRRDVSPSGRPGFYDFIQTDASINPGNSGGPLFDAEGRVIGISAAVNASGQGIGFAIPANLARDVLPALYDDRAANRSRLGVTVQDLSAELAESFGVATGVVVVALEPEGPAMTAGLRVGDVIARFDGNDVERGHRFRWLASRVSAGRTVTLSLVREGRPFDVAVIPAEAAPSGRSFSRPTMPEPRPELEPLGFQLGGPPVSMPAGTGFRVVAVDVTSRAFVAGLREGDLVVVKDEGVARPTSVQALVRELGAKPLVRLYVQRGLKPMFVAFKRSGR